MQMIEKPTILISSLGRTGTEFFAELFGHILPDSTSLHEPDIFEYPRSEDRLGHFLRRVQRAGIWRMVVLKALGKWTLVRLSSAKFLGRVQQREAVSSLAAQRRDFINKMPGSVYMEANYGYYGLFDITGQVFEAHRAVFLVRDGRDWVRSFMDRGEAYGITGLRKLISHSWPTASAVREDPYAESWLGFSRFEKICWAWSRLNEYALRCMSTNPNARLYRFEQVFLGEDRYRVLEDLINFSTSIPGISPPGRGATAGWLERSIHQGSHEFPTWDKWTVDQKRQFRQICGPLMKELGYKIA